MSASKRNTPQNSFPDEVLPEPGSSIDPYDILDIPDEMIERSVLHINGVPVPRGRPRVAHPKTVVTIRLDADVVAHYRATGTGWQSRVNTLLRKAARLKAKA